MPMSSKKKQVWFSVLQLKVNLVNLEPQFYLAQVATSPSTWMSGSLGSDGFLPEDANFSFDQPYLDAAGKGSEVSLGDAIFGRGSPAKGVPPHFSTPFHRKLSK